MGLVSQFNGAQAWKWYVQVGDLVKLSLPLWMNRDDKWGVGIIMKVDFPEFLVWWASLNGPAYVTPESLEAISEISKGR